jgi:hypothetical protein
MMIKRKKNEILETKQNYLQIFNWHSMSIKDTCDIFFSISNS